MEEPRDWVKETQSERLRLPFWTQHSNLRQRSEGTEVRNEEEQALQTSDWIQIHSQELPQQAGHWTLETHSGQEEEQGAFKEKGEKEGRRAVRHKRTYGEKNGGQEKEKD